MSNNKETGKFGEDLSVKYLEEKGYKILERNRHFSSACEIDIIALKRDTLVFVEVKTRKTNFLGVPLEAITPAKYKNIKTGLYSYLALNPKYKKYRIDAVSIVLEPEVQIEHLENI